MWMWTRIHVICIHFVFRCYEFIVSVNKLTLTVSRLIATKHEMFTDYMDWGIHIHNS